MVRVRTTLAAFVALAVAAAVPTAAAPTGLDPTLADGPPALLWSGYPWIAEPGGVSQNASGGPQTNDPSAVWTDAAGHLHLKLIQTASGLAGPNLVAGFAPTYGTYRWTLERATVAPLDPAAVLGMFIYSAESTSDGVRNREIDIEDGQFLQRTAPNAQYVVQPYYAPHRRIRFAIKNGPGTVTQQFTWAPGQVTFSTWLGPVPSPKTLVRQYVFSGGDIPRAGDTTLNMNLWWCRATAAPTPGRSKEVVIDSFSFTPAGSGLSKRLG